MNIYVSVIEVILYYIFSLSISTKILNAHISALRIVISILGFIPLLLTLMINDNDWSFTTVEIYLLIEILFTKLTVSEVSIFKIIKIYLFVFFFNTLLSVCIDYIFSLEKNIDGQIELTVNILTSTGIILLCHTKQTKKIQKIINLTPNFIKTLMLVMLIYFFLS